MLAKHKRTVIGAISISFVLTLLPAQLPKMSHATAGSAWFGAGLSLTKLDDLAVGQVPTDSVNGNTDCSELQLTTRPEWRELLPPHTLLQPAVETDACVVQTAYGVADTRSANIQLFDTQQAGPLTAYAGSASVLPVPNNVMSLSFTSNGFVQVNQNTVSKLQAETNQLDHTVKYHLTGPPDFMLTDLAGHPLPTNYDSLSFSSDGRWMVINSPGHAVIRVNLSSFAVTPFAAPFDYTTSLGPNPQTAITNDGRYVAVGSASFRTLKLYDLSTCAVPPAALTGPISCQSRDLWALLQGQLAGLSSFSNLRFINDDVLSLYLGIQATTTSPLAVSKYDLAVAGHKRMQLSYLGLGDSFSSGEGAYAYEIGTDSSNNLCHLSTVSYPYLLAGRLAANSFHTVACSGALMNDVLGTGSDYTGQVKDKIPLFSRDVPAILQAFRPGYIEQIQFARHYIPETATITISGNDIGFADLIQECAADVLHGTCYPTYEDWLEVLTTINAQQAPLTALYNHLRRASAPTSRLYAVGYPQIVYPEGNCADNVHLNHHELTLAVQVIEQLNSVVKTAAAAAGIQYIDVSQAFAGHRLCETTSHDVAVNGLTLGNDAPGFSHGPIGNESYHPNQLGHQLLAKSIQAGSHNLSLPMPGKHIAVKALSPAANPTLGSLPTSNRPIKTLMPKAITDTKLLKKQHYQLTMPGKTLGLASGASYVATLGSQNLGSFTAGGDTNLSLTITIPPGQSNGYQLLDISGPGLSGQPIDLRQTVYVDGTNDESAPPSNPATSVCVVVPASGHDVDHDGIDDACDGYIGHPPSSASGGASSDGAASSSSNGSVTSSQPHNSATPASVASVIIQTGQPQFNTMPVQVATKSAPFSQTPQKSEVPYNPQPTAQPQVLATHSALPSAYSHTMNTSQPFPSYHSHPHNLWWLLVAIGFSATLIGTLYTLWQYYRARP